MVKGESAVYHRFLFFPAMFSKRLSLLFCKNLGLSVTTLPNDKILDQFQFERLCRRQNKCRYEINFVMGRVEKIVGKGENAGCQHFSPFPTMFSKVLIVWVVKSWDCMSRS